MFALQTRLFNILPNRTSYIKVNRLSTDLSKEARLFGGCVTPLLDNGLGHLPRVGLRAVADLLGHVDALLGRLQVGHQLRHVLAALRRVQLTCFFRNLIMINKIETMISLFVTKTAHFKKNYNVVNNHNYKRDNIKMTFNYSL